MRKIWPLTIVVVLVMLMIGCDRIGVNTGDKISTNITTVVTQTNAEGEEVAVMVLSRDGTAWVSVELAAPDLLIERNVEEINGNYVYQPGQ